MTPHSSDDGTPARPKADAPAYVSLGSNLADRARNLATALRLLSETPGLSLERVSSVYETEPVGVTDQPRFLNLVARVSTSLPPRDLLRTCLRIEGEMGRRRGKRWGPRVIDVDVLLVGDARLITGEVALPHPRMKQRQFVLIPLAEIAPDLTLPDGERLADLVRPTDDVRRLGELNDLLEAGDRR